jgi:hypothetical protein
MVICHFPVIATVEACMDMTIWLSRITVTGNGPNEGTEILLKVLSIFQMND